MVFRKTLLIEVKKVRFGIVIMQTIVIFAVANVAFERNRLTFLTPKGAKLFTNIINFFTLWDVF